MLQLAGEKIKVEEAVRTQKKRKEGIVTIGRSWLLRAVGWGAQTPIFMGLSGIMVTQKAEGIQLHGVPLT